MRIALAQLNPTVGDIAGNTQDMRRAIDRARAEQADVLIGTELGLIGYPPRDLLYREGIVDGCEKAVTHIARHAAETAGEMTVIVGHPAFAEGGPRTLRNRVSVLRGGRVIARYDKQLLPGYDVFDEDRYFDPGAEPVTVEIAGRRAALAICEDLWQARDVSARSAYARDPLRAYAEAECDLIVAICASPFVAGKYDRHMAHLAGTARALRRPIVMVNQSGANDDLIFDGRSVIMNADGSPRAILPGFEPCVRTVDLAAEDGRAPGESWPVMREIFHALVLGIRDYAGKTGHGQMVLGISGGIDSALCAVLAAAAIGPENVTGVIMPSKYSSAHSVEDARALAEALKLADAPELAICDAHDVMQGQLEAVLGKIGGTLAEENLQARLRGVMLMAVANHRRALVIATSNKSEIAMGYSTLYGDMCGAVSPLGDLLKTRVYDLARWINDNAQTLGFARPPIPDRSISKPPSAELRPDQTDQDTLPPYETLDMIVERWIDHEQSANTIASDTGLDPALVRKTVRAIDIAQYKREQSAVIFKVSPRAFGRGRVMPIVMKPGAVEVRGSEPPVGDANRQTKAKAQTAE